MSAPIQERLPFDRDDDGWRLDRETRDAGRRGLAEARAALAAAVRRAEKRADMAQPRKAA